MRKGFRRSRAPIKRDYETKVVEIKRVTRVVAGGKRMRFRALVVAGNKKGKVGVGLKKGADVADAVGKASEEARKNMINVDISPQGSIAYGVRQKYKAARIILKPAPLGTGIIAGGPVRAVVDMAGIQNISSKMLGSANKVSNVRATYEALKHFQKTADTAKDEKVHPPKISGDVSVINSDLSAMSSSSKSAQTRGAEKEKKKPIKTEAK